MPNNLDQTASIDGIDAQVDRSFQTRRQIQLYKSGKQTGSTVVPVRVHKLQAKARQLLSEEAYDWVAGAAGAEETLRGNSRAFRRWSIVPRMLCNVEQRDFSVTLFGRRLTAPILLAPIGVQKLLHPEGELAAARAAAHAGLNFVLSTVATTTMEEIAETVGRSPRWFQLYWPKDPDLTISFLNRAEQSGFEAIVVTLDTQTLGWRERNLELAHLPFLKAQGLANYLADPVFRRGLPHGRENDVDAAADHYLNVFSNLAHTWADLPFLKKNTRLPLLLKGIQHPDDARRAIDAGCDGIIVSNHGGRQVDGGIATLDALPGVVKAVAGRVPVLIDGGIRRGADVFKALALGARAVLVGRPYMWALAINGEAGVRDYLSNLLADFDLTCALSGKSTLADISRQDVVRFAKR